MFNKIFFFRIRKKKIELLEIRRQSIHLFFGMILAMLLFFKIIDGFFLIGLFFLTLTFCSLIKYAKIPIFFQFLQIFERKKDLQSFPGKGLLFFVLGTTLSAIFFSRFIATASILILAFGDSVSHVFGRHFGRIKTPFHKKKYLEGLIFGVLLSTLAASFFMPFYQSFLASLISMILEFPTITFRKFTIDDNILIPLSASLTFYLLEIFEKF